MTALVVAGPAGSGKSTLGRELARRTRAVLLDLDTITNPLLEVLHPGSGTGSPSHWNSPELRPLVRPARYAALLALAREQVALRHDVVLVAPFTAELAGGPEWTELRAALAPVEPTVLWLEVPADVLAARVRERGEDRDAFWTASPPTPPAVPHRALDATLAPDELADLVMGG